MRKLTFPFWARYFARPSWFYCMPPLYITGLGIPRGDGSAVVLIPAFLCPDAYLAPLHQWLARIGYKPFFSGIGFNTECPNLLIKRQLNDTIEKALTKSGRKVHLIGHSLGGIIGGDRGEAASGYRFRHHFGRTISWNGRTSQHFECGGDSATADLVKTWRGRASGLLYGALYLRLSAFFATSYACVGS